MDAVKALVELGADKEAATVKGATPLHQAAYHGHVACAAVKVLVVLGADKARGS